MSGITKTLAKSLEDQGVKIDPVDNQTLILRALPLNPNQFNKERTNLMVRYLDRTKCYMICVDEDLEFTGVNKSIHRALMSQKANNGWRPLLLSRFPQRSFDEAVSYALDVLWGDGEAGGQELRLDENGLSRPDSASARNPEGLLLTFGRDLTQLAKDRKLLPTIGRDEEIQDIIACVTKWGQTRTPLIVAESGCGKTQLIHGVAAQLREMGGGLRLIDVDLIGLLSGTMFPAEKEDLLRCLFSEMARLKKRVFSVENINFVVTNLPCGSLLLQNALDAGVKMIATARQEHLPLFRDDALKRRFYLMGLTELSPNVSVEALESLRDTMSEHHKVEVTKECLPIAVKASLGLSGCLPTKAIDLLDEAASLARMRGSNALGPDDVLALAAQRRELEFLE